MNTYDVIFEVLRCGLFGGSLSDSTKKSFEDEYFCKVVFKFARSHDVAHLLYYCLQKGGVTLPEGEVAQRYQNEQFKALFRVEQLNYEVEQICATLEDAGVDFILLKGSVLRKSYPEEWMRTSCDVDVLIKEADSERARAALEGKINYVFIDKYEYDLVFTAPSGNNLELHFALVEDNPITKEAANILNNVWEYTVPLDGYNHGFKMNSVMYYFFHIYHLAKHIKKGGGCGIKPFLDMMYIDDKADNDAEIRALLEKGGLLKVALLSEELVKVWFIGEAHSEASANISEFVLNGGVYGNMENRIVTTRSLGKSKLRYFIVRIFMPYSEMKNRYPELETKKWLFVPYQFRRWFDLLREGKARSSFKELKTNNDLSAEDVERVARMWRELGI